MRVVWMQPCFVVDDAASIGDEMVVNVGIGGAAMSKISRIDLDMQMFFRYPSTSGVMKQGYVSFIN